jgi:hypothetical protein
MRLSTQTQHQRLNPTRLPLGIAGRWIDWLFERTPLAAAWDATVGVRRAKRRIGGEALPKDIYDEPCGDTTLAVTADIIREKFGAELVGVCVWGRAHAHSGASSDYRVVALCKTPEGKSLLLVARRQRPKQAEPCGPLDARPELALPKWAIENQIAWAKVGDEWVWKSGQRGAGSRVLTPHPRKLFENPSSTASLFAQRANEIQAQCAAEGDLLATLRHGVRDWQAERAAKAAKPGGWLFGKTKPQSKKTLPERLATLLPKDKIEAGLALEEAAALREALGTVDASTSKARPARRSASRI